MKTLALLRHAKSSWSNSLLTDKERPLAPKGINACSLMAPFVFPTAENYDNIYCSGAIRAKQTLALNIIGAGIDGAAIDSSATDISTTELTETIEYSDDIYTFDWRQVLHFCQHLPSHSNKVLIIGHNPAFTDIINYLANEQLTNLPTCGFALLESKTQSWQSLNLGSMTLRQLVTPKLVKTKAS